MTAEIRAALAAPRKTMAERCSKWIGGKQCDNYRAHGSQRCAMHKTPEAQSKPV